MAVKKFAKEYLLDELDVIGNSVSDVITDTSRWSEHHKIVFQDKDGKFYEAYYSCGATECQDERPWQDESIIECDEVEQREVQVNKWVSVDTPKPKATAKKKSKKDNAGVNQEVINIRTQIDELVDQYNFVDKSIEETKAVYEKRIDEMKNRLSASLSSCEAEKLHILSQIKVLIPQAEAKGTKTQLKLSLPSGDVVVKKGTNKLDYDKSKLLEVAEKEIDKYMEKKQGLADAICETQKEINEKRIEDPISSAIDDLVAKRLDLEDEFNSLECGWTQFVKCKQIKDFDWATFKERLVIEDNKIIDTETGELVNIDGLSVKEVSEEIQIKY